MWDIPGCVIITRVPTQHEQTWDLRPMTWDQWSLWSGLLCQGPPVTQHWQLRFDKQNIYTTHQHQHRKYLNQILFTVCQAWHRDFKHEDQKFQIRQIHFYLSTSVQNRYCKDQYIIHFVTDILTVLRQLLLILMFKISWAWLATMHRKC